MVDITVAVCTHNPGQVLLDWALASLDGQTLDPSRFRVLVVDNDSSPPLDQQALRRGRRIQIDVVREPRRGVVFARQTAIRSCDTSLIAFLDDDNFFASTYLEEAVRISAAHPCLGAFGGRAYPLVPNLERSWINVLLPFLGARDYGDEPIVSDRDEWGHWEPIGAGCVFRRAVGEKYAEFVNQNQRAHELGRRGQELMSGEDSLLARCAYRVGLQCAYQPSLTLWHYMKPSRLTYKTIAKTMYGHGRSHVRLERILEKPVTRPGLLVTAIELARRLPFRAGQHGWKAGSAHWCWDLGYFAEARRT